MDKSRIVKVRKNEEGDITDVMLEDGAVVSMNEAIQMVRQERIEGVNVGTSKNGREFLRANPNGTENDNLDQLPPF